ncbi:MAG: hypothetical protein PHS49_05190 [Candidatus Gracilibacteria bacterium]|nr:hypothetical protein [Candidatus Gracilibacteria bacterium]
MGLKNFVDSGINTTKKIYESGNEAILLNNLSLLEFFGKALKDTSIGAYNVFIKAEIDGLLKKGEVEKVVNETSDKVAYLLGGYYLNPSTLLNIKNKLEQSGVKTILINERYNSKKTLGNTIRNLKEKINQEKGKDIVLFGYSAGGVIAHRIGRMKGYKSVSFGITDKLSETMVGTLLSLTKDDKIKDFNLPDSGINIEETFSAMVPNMKDSKKNSIRLDNVYSHMAIGRDDVIEEINKQILMAFKSKRI